MGVVVDSISNNRNFPVGSPLLSISLTISPSSRPLSGSYFQLNSVAAVLPKYSFVNLSFATLIVVSTLLDPDGVNSAV